MTPDLSFDYEGENRRAKIVNGMETKIKNLNCTIYSFFVQITSVIRLVALYSTHFQYGSNCLGKVGISIMVQRIKMCASKNLTDVWYVCLKPGRPTTEHELALPKASPFFTYLRACGPCKRVFTVGVADAAASPGSMRKRRMNVSLYNRSCGGQCDDSSHACT